MNKEYRKDVLENLRIESIDYLRLLLILALIIIPFYFYETP